MSRRALSLLVVLLAIACCTGLVLAAKPGGGGGCPQPRANCICAAIYDPVICDGGCRYSNSCVASCAGARGCVSTGGGPIEVSAAEPAVDEGSDACSANATPATVPDLATDFTDFLALEAAGNGPCKSCKDRPTCPCRYNGLPRVSCTPCCFGNLGIPQVCFD